MSDRDKTIALIAKLRDAGSYGPGIAPTDLSAAADALESALSAVPVEGEVAKALTDAAEAIRREAGADECAIHDVMHEHQLPEMSRVMLNGVTRACERLVRRSAVPVEGKVEVTDEMVFTVSAAIEEAEWQWQFEFDASRAGRAYVDPGERAPFVARAAIAAALGVEDTPEGWTRGGEIVKDAYPALWRTTRYESEGDRE